GVWRSFAMHSPAPAYVNILTQRQRKAVPYSNSKSSHVPRIGAEWLGIYVKTSICGELGGGSGPRGPRYARGLSFRLEGRRKWRVRGRFASRPNCRRSSTARCREDIRR